MNTHSRQESLPITYPCEGAIAPCGYTEVSRTLHIEERYGTVHKPPASTASSQKMLIATVLLGGGLIVSLTASIAWNMALSHQNQELIKAQSENTQLKAWKGQVKTFVCN